MAEYKVPQDVEADDKLLGPFSFRQFVYLLIAAGLIALAVGLFQIFPLLAIIPVPFILLFAALALPLKKDQPMETYLAALISYYLKPRKRLWTPGQRESSILITAPKVVEDIRTRNISGEEATSRLSFLADIVDSEGRAINNNMRDDLAAEAAATADMFENNHFDSLDASLKKDEANRHAEVVQEMKEAIKKNEIIGSVADQPIVKNSPAEFKLPLVSSPLNSPTIILPNSPVARRPLEKSNNPKADNPKTTTTLPPKPDIIELANNSDFSVATIAKEANRINRKDEDEVFISLH